MNTKDILIGLICVLVIIAGSVFLVRPMIDAVEVRDERIDALEQRIKAIEQKIDKIEERNNELIIQPINERIDKIEQRITEKNNAIDKRIVAMQGVIRMINIEIDNIFDWIKERENKIEPQPIEPKQQAITWTEVIL